MATKIVTTKISPKGNKVTKTIKDTSKKTGRQQIKETKLNNKKSMSDNARKAARDTAIVTELGTTAQTEAREKTKRVQAQQNTYQKALDKWNGILKSTPDAAEGTNDGQEGTNNANGNTNTGTNPDFIFG